MMKNHKVWFLLSVIGFIFIAGCEKYHEHEKFQRPAWLPGKLYTTASVQEDINLFTECLQITGLDSIIDVSGSWTVFAPTDQAIQEYLGKHQFAAIHDIPKDELEKLVEFHIVQNPWSIDQLHSLSVFGWRTREDGKVNSYAYKRQTILQNPVEKYWTKKERNKEMIVVDSVDSDRYKKVVAPSRKNVPIFYDAYMNVNGISSEDFSFYFGRAYEYGNVYYGGAKILKGDIFAENGFLHIIDKVVEPMPNGKEFLETDQPNESYKLFLKMVYWYYPSFKPNMTATYNQPSARAGGLADTLWDLNYYDLPFFPHQENTGVEGPNYNESWIRHNGLIAPTDDAFSGFIDNVLTEKSGFRHWSDIYSLPWDIVEIIVSPHFKRGPVYPSTGYYSDIFRGKGRLKQDESAIIRREFGSNCTFIGLDTYIPDRAFTSVTGPVFCRPDFTFFRLAMQYSGTLDAIASHEGELFFFPIPDYALRTDSSLLLNWTNREDYRYNFQVYNRRKRMIEHISSNALKNKILNQVGTSMPNGSAGKEFIKTLGGNYITWDHSLNTIQGTRPCTFGYDSDSVVICSPVLLEEPADNGSTLSVRYWFNFGGKSLMAALEEHKTFYSLLQRAGLVDEQSGNLLFMNNDENYTLFIPSEAALAKHRLHEMSVAELQNVLKNHFVRGEIIFTDNKQPSGDYPTAGNRRLNIRIGPDLIVLFDKNREQYINIEEQAGTTNIMISGGEEINAVMHVIDDVLAGLP